MKQEKLHADRCPKNLDGKERKVKKHRDVNESNDAFSIRLVVHNF